MLYAISDMLQFALSIAYHFYHQRMIWKKGTIRRDGSRDFEKGWHSMSATMVGRQRKFYVSHGLWNRRQKTFEFLNWLCLLTSNPLSPYLLNRQPSFFMVQWSNFILILALLYIPIYVLFSIYLCYTYIILVYWSKHLFYTCVVSTLLIVCMTVNFFKISPASVFLESARSWVYCACPLCMHRCPGNYRS